MSDKIIAHARATITIEMEVSGSWGAACTIDQVNSQATTAAVGALRTALNGTVSGQRCKIIGEPKISTIIVSDAP